MPGSSNFLACKGLACADPGGADKRSGEASTTQEF